MGITQIFDQFYIDEPPNAVPTFGSIYWVPTPEVQEVPRILEVQRSSPEEHEITDFQIVEIGARHFQHSERLPIKRLNLEDTQELMVAKGKRRPCVVLGCAQVSGEQLNSIKDGEQRRLAKHLQRTCFLVAPMYSCSTYYERSGFGPVLTARVKALWYPHLCYMPGFNGSAPGSILRLDHTFPSCLGRGSDPAKKKVTEEVMEIVVGQLQVVCGMPPTEILVSIQELVKDCLPDGLG